MASDEIRVVVNGQRIRFDVAPYEDWSAGGRLMVQVRPVLMAMDCMQLRYDPSWGMVQATQSCMNGQETWLRLWPRDQSHVAEVGQMWQSSQRYRLDVRSHFEQGHTMASARMLGDAFDCLTQWSERERTMYYDCTQKARTHENLRRVMERVPPRLNREGIYAYEGEVPMYPTTLKAAQNVLNVMNQAVINLRSMPREAVVEPEPDRDRVLIYDAYDRGRPVAYIYPDVTYAVMDEGRLLMLKRSLRQQQSTQSKVGSAVGGLIGVLFPPATEWTVILGVAGGLLGYEWMFSITDDDINALDTCVSIAQYNAGLMETRAKMTVGVNRFGKITCAPFEVHVTTYAELYRVGVDGE